MPASELLALADQWREDPSRAAQDGQLLATTRAALASLDGTERATIARELRSHGSEQLAERLTAVEGLPVWSEEVTGVARDLLSVDDATLSDLRAAVDPDTLSAAIPPPTGEPVDDLPPPPTHGAARDAATDRGDRSSPDGSDLPSLDVADVEIPDLDVPSMDRTGSGWQPAEWRPRGSERPTAATDEPADDEPTGEHGADEVGDADHEAAVHADAGHAVEAPDRPPATDDVAGDAGLDRGPAADRTPGTHLAPGQHRAVGHGQHRAPGQRDTTRARDRFRALSATDAELDVEEVVAQLRDAPDGWQRRRLASRLIDGALPMDADVVLPLLGRTGDRTTIADRLVRRGSATPDEVAPWLPDGAAARIARRHGGR